MESKRPSLVRRFALIWLVLVLLPVAATGFFVLRHPYRELAEQQYGLYENSMNANLDLIASHFDYVSDTVTLLEDSEKLRGQMQDLSNRPGEEIRPVEVYPFVDSPITYNNIRANRAVNAVTIFVGNQLAYYALQHNTTDQPLARCANISYQAGEISSKGNFLVPGQSNGYVYYVQEFTDIYRAKQYGRFIIEINPIPTYTSADKNALSSAFYYQVDLSGYPGTAYVVHNGDGTILFSSDAGYVSTHLPNSLLSQQMENEQDYVTLTRYLSKQGLTVTFLTPRDVVYRGATQSMGRFFLFAGGLSALMLLFGFFCWDRFTRPFKAMRLYCRQSPKVAPVFDPVYREMEEIQELIGTNLDKIEELQGTIMKNHIQMKDAEIQLLQSQINPHFLFNMLDVIGWQALKDNSAGIHEMVNYLGELLRSNILLSRQEKVTIRQELLYIKNYLSLQLIRYENGFSYNINVDEEMLDSYYIPKLSLQPIVENCVVHGFKNLERAGVIDITIWEDMDEVLCTIRDNGHGFDVARYFDNPPPASQENPKLNHIALQNIQNRIKMLCGPGYGVSIKSEPGEGTTVTINLPLDRGTVTPK